MDHLPQGRAIIITTILALLLCYFPLLDCTSTTPSEDSWCFVKEGCNQNTKNSSWNQGTCASGKLQSPIDLDIKDYDELTGDSEIDFSTVRSNYDFTTFNMRNEGKHVELTGFKTASGKKPSFIWQEREDSTYTLQQIHMHWGPSNDNGSEHSIGGKKYAMEMHLIHYRSVSSTGQVFKDLSDARKSGKPDAVATIAILFAADSAGSASEALQPMMKNLGKVVHRGAKVTVDQGVLKLGDLLRLQTKALTYQGSMTVPPCAEVVVWLVIPEPINVKGEDVQLFRDTVHGVDGRILNTNRRRQQPANSRTVGVVNLKQ